MSAARQLPPGYWTPKLQEHRDLTHIDLVHVRVVRHAYHMYHTVRCKAAGHEYPVSRKRLMNRHAKGMPLKCRDCGGKR